LETTAKKSDVDCAVATVLGSKSTSDLWTHATARQLAGWERCRFDHSKLMFCYLDYTKRPECHTAYLDWVFLDAMMYSVIYALTDNLNDDVLKPGDTGRWLPPVERAFANSSDADKSHPMWLDLKLTVGIIVFRWLPTFVLLALGIGCFYIGQGWPTTGWTILGLVCLWRFYRSIRWFTRIIPRRRAAKMLDALTDGYSLLGGTVVPMRELRQSVERARDVVGRSAIFGSGFWSVLDGVCARHPGTMVVERMT
jgi:hypothetical protein